MIALYPLITPRRSNFCTRDCTADTDSPVASESWASVARPSFSNMFRMHVSMPSIWHAIDRALSAVVPLLVINDPSSYQAHVSNIGNADTPSDNRRNTPNHAYFSAHRHASFSLQECRLFADAEFHTDYFHHHPSIYCNIY